MHTSMHRGKGCRGLQWRCELQRKNVNMGLTRNVNRMYSMFFPFRAAKGSLCGANLFILFLII